MNSPLRVVLVGCGGITQAWMSYAVTRPDLLFVGLVDLDVEAARALQSKYGLSQAAVGADLAAMLQTTQPDIVFDCTIPAAHTAVTLTALAHRCHVLGEKPMATTMADAARMVAAAQAQGLTYAVIQNRRYLDQIVQYRDLVQDGRIGRLTTLNADFFLGPHFGGFREEMAHVLLLDMAIHSFDQARFIANADPVSVYCHEWNPPGSWFAHGAAAVAIFEMSNGLLFTYRGSWCAQGLPTAWACDWRAIGTQGTACWDGEEEVRAAVVTGADGFFRPTEELQIEPAAALPNTGHAGVIAEFIDSVKAGVPPQTICTDNIKSLAMVHAAIESAESGRKVLIHW
ncbi:MAG: Gfo/Idh/MocA family oxidoreductase [Caldilineaceae bacterium]|nr:Gfo/Idh/MocA family oxidoreductase [Caldilineaceae bacterium]